MRITPRQHIQAAKKPKKANPMARARVARQVPQMRKVFKGVTGVKKGGEMKEYRAGGVIRPKPTFKGNFMINENFLAMVFVSDWLFEFIFIKFKKSIK